MKKIILIGLLIVISIFVYINVNADEIIIPDSAIRVRVIANSDSIHDQSMKVKVKEYIESFLYPILIDVDDIDSARDIINSNISSLDSGISEIFEENGYDIDYDISFGYNHFPSKVYKGVYYGEGDYESLVVTIGNGEGNNWWCVLFPPLCLLEADDTNTSEAEYKFFVAEMLEKIF